MSTTATATDWDTATVEEFRANEGRVGGYFTGVPIVLVHHKGAKTGKERVSPMAAQVMDDGLAVFASKGGADENPGWYYNLLANPEVSVEFGTETFSVRAYEAKGDEYDRIWGKQTADYPTFGEYERKTAREYIPVIVLERR